MEPPAMTPEQIGAAGGDAAVRVNCYECGWSLYAGNELPEGGAEAVFAGAGCPDTCPGALDESRRGDEPTVLPPTDSV